MMIKKSSKQTRQKDWEIGIGVLENDVLSQQVKGPFLERRRAPRVSMTIPVKFQLKEKIEGWKEAESVDISKYGVRISSVSPEVTTGMKISLHIKLPGQPEPFDIEGVVVWVQRTPGKQTVECGISFENPTKISRVDKMLGFLTDQLCRFAIKHSKDYRSYPAKTEEDLKAAFGLVYKHYFARGYCKENEQKLYYNHYCVLPEAQTFLLNTKKTLLGTISLIPDTECGLPMDSIFPKEVAKLRAADRKVAEVGMLSLDLKEFDKRSFILTDFEKLSASFSLFKIVFDYARLILGITDLVIAMNPKHQGLYQYLQFKTISDVKSYSTVCDNPAVAMHVDILDVVKNLPRGQGVGSYFLKDTNPEDVLKNHLIWNDQLARLFLHEIRPMWNAVPEPHQKIIKKFYPDI